MTPEQREELKAAAQKATPGPWHSPGLGELHAENHDEIAQILYAHSDESYCGTDADADYMALANPAAILSLIAQVEALTVPMADADIEEVSQAIADRVNALTVPQWQLIETAPKDGSSILLYTAEGMIEAAWSWGCWEQAPCYATYDGCGGVALSCEPTHWQPLPTIPAIPGTKEAT